MASVFAAGRNLGFRNTPIALKYATLVFARTGAKAGKSAFSGRVVRGFTQTTARNGGAGTTTASSAARTKAAQQLGKAFFQARSVEPPQTILQQLRARLFHSSRTFRQTQSSGSTPIPNVASPKSENLSLGQRMRKLSREYGWAALGVYMALTALDFPFCYLLVRYLGTDRIGEWEHIVMGKIKMLIPEGVKQKWHEWRVSVKQASSEAGVSEIHDGVEMAGWGVEEAEESYKRDASLATQLALAYAIHKSFIFIRVPITVSITPKVVKILRGWGWDIGKRTTKAAKAANAAEVAAQKAEKAARKAQK